MAESVAVAESVAETESAAVAEAVEFGRVKCEWPRADRATKVDAMARFIALQTLCAMLCIASLVSPSAGSAQQTRKLELEKFYGELALVEKVNRQIEGGIATAHPRLALLTPPLALNGPALALLDPPAAATTSASESLTELESVDEAELQNVKTARRRLAVGVPLLAMGAAGLVVAGTVGGCRTDNDGYVHDSAAVGTIVLGSMFTAAGIGLSTTGSRSLLRSSKESRAAAKTKQARRRTMWTAVGTTLGGIVLMGSVTAMETFCIEIT